MSIFDRCIIAVLVGIAIGVLIGLTPAPAAEWKECEDVASSVQRIVVAATGDNDLIGYIRDRAFSHCLLADEVPVRIAFGQPSDDWATRCAMEYRSFRPSDGTVVRHGSHTRVRCPL